MAIEITGRTELERLILALYGRRSTDGECPHCGWTHEQFNESGFVGCPLCYTVFGELIRSELGPSPVSSLNQG